MKILKLSQMETLQGGDMEAFCDGVFTAGAVYTVGANLSVIGLTNLWNPVEWVSLAFVGIATVCAISN